MPSIVRQILKVGKGKHIPKDMEGGGFPQACDEEETQRLRQNTARKKWKKAERVASFGDLGGLGGGGGVKHEAVPQCWGCSMVYIGKNIGNGSKNPRFLPVICALCTRCTVPGRPLLSAPQSLPKTPHFLRILLCTPMYPSLTPFLQTPHVFCVFEGRVCGRICKGSFERQHMGWSPGPAILNYRVVRRHTPSVAGFPVAWRCTGCWVQCCYEHANSCTM